MTMEEGLTPETQQHQQFTFYQIVEKYIKLNPRFGSVVPLPMFLYCITCTTYLIFVTSTTSGARVNFFWPV